MGSTLHCCGDGTAQLWGGNGRGDTLIEQAGNPNVTIKKDPNVTIKETQCRGTVLNSLVHSKYIHSGAQ